MYPHFIRVWDARIFHWINSGWGHPWLDELARWLTPLGTVPFVTLYMIIWISLARPSGYYYLLAGLINSVENRLLKFIFSRRRPFETLSSRLPLSVNWNQVSDASFPSGHALTVFTAAFL